MIAFPTIRKTGLQSDDPPRNCTIFPSYWKRSCPGEWPMIQEYSHFFPAYWKVFFSFVMKQKNMINRCVTIYLNFFPPPGSTAGFTRNAFFSYGSCLTFFLVYSISNFINCKKSGDLGLNAQWVVSANDIPFGNRNKGFLYF